MNPRIMLPAILIACCWLVGGCGTTPPAETTADTVAYPPLSLSAFDFLDAGEQARRHELSRAAYERAAAATDLATRLAELQAAGDLAPDNAQAWYRLAEQRIWFGDDAQTAAALAACRAAGGWHGQEDLLEAWWRYDQGEWALGLAAVERAGETPTAALVRSLLQAGAGEATTGESTRWACWVGHWLAGRRFRVLLPNQHPDILRHGVIKEEHYISLDPLQDACRVPPDDFERAFLRPHRARYLRDMGLIHEAYGQTAEALLAFEMAAAVMPWADEEAVRQVGVVGGRRPVWLAQERYYVTGSLAAWLDLAFQELRAAADAATRSHWRGQALAASQRCLFRDLATSESLRSRWLAPLAVDDPVWSGAELDLARRLLTADGAEDPEILASLGRQELLAGRHEQAVATLERAQDLGFRTPLASTHLAIALVAVGREEEARGLLDRALVIDPDLAEAWYNRGILSLHQDDAAAALADLERAADLAPENPEVREALQGARQLAVESATP